jgi:glycosyltransferase involved in cell wall biosynthesis
VLEVIGNASAGGMESYIANFIRHLPSEQFQVTCICPYESPFTATLRGLGSGVFIAPIADDPPWRSIQLAVEVVRLHQIDVLHAHMPKAHVLAGLAACLTHTPVVATLHGMNVTSHELGISRAVGSHLIANCQEAYMQALAMGVPADRVTLARNGVDVAAFTPDGSGAKLRAMIAAPPGTPLVGFVGRLEHEKGPDLFLRAAEYVHERRPDVHFVVAGEGTMREQLGEMCTRMRLDQHVHFVGWWANTAHIYAGVDIVAHTSRSDGTSLVLLEAMACGRPAVALAVGGVLEIVENDGTGLIAGAGDWEGVGRHLVQLLAQPERARRMGQAARARVEQHFDLRMNTQRTTDVLRQVALAYTMHQPPAAESDLALAVGAGPMRGNRGEAAG